MSRLAVVVALATAGTLAVLGNTLFGVRAITDGFADARISLMQTANAQRDVLVFHRAVLRLGRGGSTSDAELRQGLAARQLEVLAAFAPNRYEARRLERFRKQLLAVDVASLRRPGALESADRSLWHVDEGLKIVYDEGTRRFGFVTNDALSTRVRLQRVLAGLIVLTVVTATVWAIRTRRRSRSDLRAAHELQAKVVATSTDLMCLISLDGSVVYASPALGPMLGRADSEVIGRRWTDVVHEEDAVRSAAAFAACSDRDRPEPLVGRLRHRDGHWVDVEGVVAPITGEDGAVEMLLAICRDVTERKRSEEARAALEERLHQSQRIEAVGRLAGGIAHDFNNLLLAISGYSDLALAKLPAGSRARADVDEVRSAAARATTLTRQLLAYSRKQVLQPRNVDLNEIVSGLETMLSTLLRDDIVLVTTLEPGVGTVRADVGQLEQVIMNLAINARDAMPAGGRLEIATDEVSPGAYVRLTVTDTGEGMDAETLGQIFEPFFTTKPQGEGTGLGLATVYGIVTQSGGHVVAHSTPAAGSTFEVLLPRSVGEADDAGEQPAAPARANGETVLLVEDEDAVRRLVSTLLAELGYEVLAAAGGDEAIELASRHEGPIDVLLTDVVMPGTSGRDVADALRRTRPSIGVVFVSGYTEQAIETHGALVERAAFVQKPFSTVELSTKLRDVIEGEGAHRVAA